MDRRRALLTSAIATMALGVGSVGIAAVTDIGVFGFGGGRVHTTALAAPTTTGPSTMTAATAAPTQPQVVTVQQDVYDQYVVPSSQPTAGSTAPDETSRTGPVASAPTTTAKPVDHQPGPTTTTVPPPTTAPPTTPTTRPPGVPDDWPADKPIPPMPANCRHAQLEDNGVWNCDH